MTFDRFAITIRCDACPESLVIVDRGADTDEGREERRALVKQRARGKSWSVDGARHLCPSCAASSSPVGDPSEGAGELYGRWRR